MKTDHFSTDFELWIDSIDVDAINHAKDLGVLHGVTTNPSILSKGSQAPLKTIAQLLDCFEGPLAVQVTLLEAEGMIQQAKTLHKISERIIVKIPCIQAGYQAMQALKRLNIPVMATAIYTVRQYFLASLCGAHYAAPYFSRMIKQYHEQAGLGFEAAYQKTMQTINKILNLSHSRDTKVLLAAIDSAGQVDDLIEAGMTCATLRAGTYKELLDDFPKSILDLKAFQQDWYAASNGDDWIS